MTYDPEKDRERRQSLKYKSGRKQRYENRKQLGLCVYCGTDNITVHSGKTLCHECLFKHWAKIHLDSRSRWRELRELWENQKGICPYTGQILILGVDASIDHILPSCRYPELKYDIQNLEWVNLQVNYMKRDLTKDEFLALCKQVTLRAE